MLDPKTLALDREILSFIRKHAGRSARNEEFQALALKIFAYQFERNANYRKFCEREGKTPGNVKSWKKIPAMPAVGFKELVLTTFPLKGSVRRFKTSGTTRQERGVHFFDTDTLKLYEASILPPFKKYLMHNAKKLSFYFLIASPEEAPESSLSYMMGVVNSRLAGGGGCFYFRGGQALYGKLARDLAHRRQPVILLSTAFSLKGFLDYLQTEKIQLALPRGSRLMETGGFKGRIKEVSKSALYRECEKRLGIRKSFCVSEYGMTELSSQFYDSAFRNRFRGPAWARALIVDPRTRRQAREGEVGLIRVVDLANRGSVLAVQTEDLGQASGSGFKLLGRASGAELRGCSLSYEEFLNG